MLENIATTMNTFARLMDHMDKYHPNAKFWGDSGTLDGSIQICFLCGRDLAKKEENQKSRRGSSNMSNSRNLKIGDYVLATKWHDGDPLDHWCVGFYDGLRYLDRHFVVDNNGKQCRANGFRRVQKISKARGKWLLEKMNEIEESARFGSKRSLWGWVRQPMKVNAN